MSTDDFKVLASSIGDLNQLAAVPDVHSKVWKDECMFCHCDSECNDGLYVNMKSFQAYCLKHRDIDIRKNSKSLYLVEKSNKVPKKKDQDGAKVDRLGIGVPGGFDAEVGDHDTIREYSVCLNCNGKDAMVGLGDNVIPEMIKVCADAIVGHDSMCQQASVETWEEHRKVSKYAKNLELLPCNRKVPMDKKKWKCDETGASENLWLNLGTGHIGSGRPQWDGTGGNGAALKHYQDTGKKYPLVVKLGTITPSGADVYSYASDEDDMVLDPWLGDHLAHWGINMMKMEKTDKSMTELQIERNANFEFDTITESGCTLSPLSGRGFVGLKNLGNSCYINSVLQLIWSMADLQLTYFSNADAIQNSSPSNPAFDFLSQFLKVGMALASESQGCSGDPRTSVSPWMFKKICGSRHPEFATGHQQDAYEFFSFILEQIDREEFQGGERMPKSNINKAFEVGFRSRIECSESHRVSYKSETSTCVSLQIPTDMAANSEEVQENARDNKRLKKEDEQNIVIPRVTLDACFTRLCQPEHLTEYFSAYLNTYTKATRTTKIEKFPKYLMLHMRRYYVDDNWSPQKLDVTIDAPETLCLEAFRAGNVPENELLQPDKPEFEPNVELLTQLLSMGFDLDRCKHALLSTGNSDLNTAMEYILANPNIENSNISEESIQSLCNMGFSAEQSKSALEECEGNLERAVDWLFNHQDRGEEEMAILPQSDSSEYELMGFISHIGKNTNSGHYVCHVKKDGIWTIYNDEKVAKSSALPSEFGYMYLYRQKI